jgi:hypothetical protein
LDGDVDTFSQESQVVDEAARVRDVATDEQYVRPRRPNLADEPLERVVGRELQVQLDRLWTGSSRSSHLCSPMGAVPSR